jgi:dTMP kinase
MAHGGVLITLEGGEGSGKTTQCALLAEALRRRGRSVAVTREPGGTPAGERLRALLLDPSVEPWEPVAEVLLFAASRAETVAKVIRPALQTGTVVLCDRFADSSLAYQGYGLGVDLGFIRMVNDAVTGGLVPDLTLLLDLPPEEGQARKRGRGAADRIEARGPAYHHAVRSGYLRLAAEEPGRFRVVDAARSVSEVHEEVLAAVEDLLAGRVPS